MNEYLLALFVSIRTKGLRKKRAKKKIFNAKINQIGYRRENFFSKKKETIYEFSKIKKYEKKLIFSDKNVS